MLGYFKRAFGVLADALEEQVDGALKTHEVVVDGYLERVVRLNRELMTQLSTLMDRHKVDAQLIKQRMSIDPNIRADAMCGVARKVNEDVPFIFLFGRRYHAFARNYVKNITIMSNGEEGGRLAELWIEK